MNAYENVNSWAYLDKLICQWRKVEEEVRAACGLPPVAPYGRCALFRGQAPTEEWLRESGLLQQSSSSTSPITTPVEPAPAPVPVPIPVPSPVNQPSAIELTSPPITSGGTGTTTEVSDVPSLRPSASSDQYPPIDCAAYPSGIPLSAYSFMSLVPSPVDASSENASFDRRRRANGGPTSFGSLQQ